MGSLLASQAALASVVSEGTTELASSPGIASGSPSISADGRYVAFVQDGVWVRDRQTGALERADLSGSGEEGNDASSSARISADGRHVVFASSASNLVPGDANAATDIFVRDRQLATTERVSVSSTDAEANGSSGTPSISAGGRFVAFESGADNLAAADDGNGDVFLRDRLVGATLLIRVENQHASSGGSGPVISADGRYVAFSGLAADGVLRLHILPAKAARSRRSSDTNPIPPTWPRRRTPPSAPTAATSPSSPTGTSCLGPAAPVPLPR